jgi:hypothetical protein
MNYIWKIWLKPNTLTKDVDNDYIAEVSTVGNTARNADVAQAIVDEGSEIQYDTLLNILNHSDRIKRTFLASGRSVQDGVSHIAPRVHGVWTGINTRYDPNTHTIRLDMNPAPEMRELFKDVKVEVLGLKDSGAYIGLVTDGATGKTDGTITPYDTVIIEGNKIRIAPDDEDGLGIFFIRNGTTQQYQVTGRLIQNDPKKIIARTPDLPSGQYTLNIITRYAANNKPLNEPRTITYNSVLTVG